MEYSEIFDSKNFSCVMEESVNDSLVNHLLREDGQEDLAFALWVPSFGEKRFTAIVKEILLPLEGERQVHMNASFNYQYLLRACRLGQMKGYGVALLHSHPIANGWQGMSEDDYQTESRSFLNVFTSTDKPFIGLTLAADGFWSARLWNYNNLDQVEYIESTSVRCIGQYLETCFNDAILPPIRPNGKTIRTINVWGDEVNKNITRLNVGIIGLGSVGSVVAEMLSRMGISTFTLIDYDTVEDHNLDRREKD